jgi:Ca2+-binding EF-hand superfamily protein
MKKQFLALCTLSLAATFAMAADAKLTDEQIDTAFAKADTDKNGTISRAEARKFGITTQAFDKANPDKDGSLDKKEFVAAIEAQFAAANPDKDGTLDKKEARKAGVKDTKAFDAANPDKDGTLDIAEFLAALIAQAK